MAAGAPPSVDVAAIGADFYAFSAHKIYGPSGLALCGLARKSTPCVWHGGAMIDRVTFEDHLPAPSRFRRTPHIVGAIGFHAAIGWVNGIGPTPFTRMARWSANAAPLCRVPGITLFGPEDSAGIVGFALDGVHRTTSAPSWTMRGGGPRRPPRASH
jgi:cysteine desulfurase/selenocysteine lyase